VKEGWRRDDSRERVCFFEAFYGSRNANPGRFPTSLLASSDKSNGLSARESLSMLKSVARGVSVIMLAVGVPGVSITYFGFIIWHIAHGATWLLNPFYLVVLVPGGLLAPFVQWWLEDSLPLFTLIFWSLSVVGATLAGLVEDE